MAGAAALGGGGPPGELPLLRCREPTRWRAGRPARTRIADPGSVGTTGRDGGAGRGRGCRPPLSLPRVRRRAVRCAARHPAAPALLGARHRPGAGAVGYRLARARRGPGTGEPMAHHRRRSDGLGRACAAGRRRCVRRRSSQGWAHRSLAHACERWRRGQRPRSPPTRHCRPTRCPLRRAPSSEPRM